MIPAYRLCKTRHLGTAFSGEGARLNGGRWNSPGLAVVYAASSLSLATLEVLVHLEDPEALARMFSWVPVEIPEDCVEYLDVAKLAAGWNADEAGIISRSAGDAWLRAARSAVLAVPSVVTPVEWNFLLNPAHPRFSDIRIGQPVSFKPDPRLLT